jgi:hypothetical protein
MSGIDSRPADGPQLQKFAEKAHDFSRGMNPTNPTHSILDSTA